MADAAAKLLSAEEFLHWQRDQEPRYELVDGVPVLMTGASALHDLIVTNVISLLKAGLKGSRCRPTTADVALRTRIRSFRRPDVLVTCDPPRGDVFEALEPRMVVEVLSPSNTGVAWDRKIREYRQHDALEFILLIDAAIVAATLYSRSASGWDDADFDTLQDVVSLPTLGCRLAMADIYDGTGLEEALAATGRKEST